MEQNMSTSGASTTSRITKTYVHCPCLTIHQQKGVMKATMTRIEKVATYSMFRVSTNEMNWETQTYLQAFSWALVMEKLKRSSNLYHINKSWKLSLTLNSILVRRSLKVVPVSMQKLARSHKNIMQKNWIPTSGPEPIKTEGSKQASMLLGCKLTGRKMMLLWSQEIRKIKKHDEDCMQPWASRHERTMSPK